MLRMVGVPAWLFPVGYSRCHRIDFEFKDIFSDDDECNISDETLFLDLPQINNFAFIFYFFLLYFKTYYENVESKI